MLNIRKFNALTLKEVSFFSSGLELNEVNYLINLLCPAIKVYIFSGKKNRNLMTYQNCYNHTLYPIKVFFNYGKLTSKKTRSSF